MKSLVAFGTCSLHLEISNSDNNEIIMESDLLLCYNKGCGQKFKTEDNSETACIYHPGGPIFHDARKGWSCCAKRVSDFTEFLNIKGCAIGWHSNVKPPEPEKEKPAGIQEPLYQLEIRPKHKQSSITSAARPSDDEPLIDLKKTVGASLKTQLEKLTLKDSEESNSENSLESGVVKIGTSCHNSGCRVSYEGEHSKTETCVFHPGVPIFHEGLKYWTCCQKKTTDFDAFLNQEGCETGHHNWHRPKITQEKQVRVDWHQTPSTVCISIFAKMALPEETHVSANKVKLQIQLVYDGGNSVYNKTWILREVIDPVASDVKLLGAKVEINLKKLEAFSWSTLELPPSTAIS